MNEQIYLVKSYLLNTVFAEHNVGGVSLLCTALCFSLLAGCTPYSVPIRIKTDKTAKVISVDDSRQIITMGSPYVYLEKPDVDWAQARVDAAAMCRKRTGHELAEPVGNTRRECLRQVGTDCVQYAIVGDYRCIEPAESQ